MLQKEIGKIEEVVGQRDGQILLGERMLLEHVVLLINVVTTRTMNLQVIHYTLEHSSSISN